MKFLRYIDETSLPIEREPVNFITERKYKKAVEAFLKAYQENPEGRSFMCNFAKNSQDWLMLDLLEEIFDEQALVTPAGEDYREYRVKFLNHWLSLF
jgi:hypothetical protein